MSSDVGRWYSNPSAVIVTHKPTNIRVECNSQRSMHRNKALALKCLQSKLIALFGSIPKEEDFIYEVGDEIPVDKPEEGEDNDS